MKCKIFIARIFFTIHFTHYLHYSKIYWLYQTGSVDTQVAAFNKGKGINYQLAEIASNKTGGGTEKYWSGKADIYNVL